MEYQWLETPSITSPLGWTAGAVYAGIKTYGEEPRFDVALLASERPCAVGGIFTTNKVCGAPVTVTRERIASGLVQALVVNSGCSNVAMGQRGLDDARAMAALAARKLGIRDEAVLVGSTGVIGRPLPMAAIGDGLARIELDEQGGAAFSRAIMTTDTVPKVHALKFSHGGRVYTVAGTAKGSGMVHPDMATVFCFLTTDAPVNAAWLQEATRRVGDATINMVDVDMDTSTSDMMLTLANGAAGGDELTATSDGCRLLEGAMLEVATRLARDLAADGEGATALLVAELRGARSVEDARAAARAVVSSPLVKSMITGRDPNLGRVLMAIGRSGADVDVTKTSVWIGEHLAFERGAPTSLDLGVISRAMGGDCVTLRVDLGLGEHSATAWGCNLTEEYVRINAHYTT